jgi:nucleoside-diphosphate-sugar epimerase
MAMTKADSDDLYTIAVAPHQVYGPRDNLFLPNVLEAGGTGMLRIFSSTRTGRGYNRVCFTHVDNYAHALIIAERALTPTSPARGKFYIVTDGDTHTFPEGYVHFWEAIDQAVVGMGFSSIWERYKLPDWLIMPVAYLCDGIGWATGRRLKLNPFSVRVLTMHRWFNIAAATKDLNYSPIVPFKEGWADTIVWFRDNWLPKFRRSMSGSGVSGLAPQTERKIDIQAGKKAE